MYKTSQLKRPAAPLKCQTATPITPAVSAFSPPTTSPPVRLFLPSSSSVNPGLKPPSTPLVTANPPNTPMSDAPEAGSHFRRACSQKGRQGRWNEGRARGLDVVKPIVVCMNNGIDPIDDNAVVAIDVCHAIAPLHFG
ncbi:hypothetical protein AaE_006947 [Aphanomyces astaci]|uniref:Uncharacterized protein n=1 Tax=Aphanomyces astaci TaxID=112090 RepID=A0A6A5AJI2_APHAT|nr:hypothetical protein AaE_006947 [Aphanomyces astaci]